MLTDGRFNSKYYPVHFSQVAKVDTHITKWLLTEFTAKALPGPAFSMVQLHMSAKTAWVSIGLPAYWADVRPQVTVAIHVALQVMLELETPVAGRTSMQRMTSREITPLHLITGCWSVACEDCGALDCFPDVCCPNTSSWSRFSDVDKEGNGTSCGIVVSITSTGLGRILRYFLDMSSSFSWEAEFDTTSWRFLRYPPSKKRQGSLFSGFEG